MFIEEEGAGVYGKDSRASAKKQNAQLQNYFTTTAMVMSLLEASAKNASTVPKSNWLCLISGLKHAQNNNKQGSQLQTRPTESNIRTSEVLSVSHGHLVQPLSSHYLHSIRYKWQLLFSFILLKICTKQLNTVKPP